MGREYFGGYRAKSCFRAEQPFEGRTSQAEGRLGSDLVRGAAAGDLDRSAEGPLGLLPRPLLAQVVGDVRQDDPLDTGALRMVAGLGGGHVPADTGALGTRQRRLDDQQVRVLGDLDQ